MTEQANIPKPASPLPWTDRGSFGDADIVSASGDSVYREYPYEGGWFQEPADLAYLTWAANNAQALYEALEKAEAALGTWAESCGMGWQYAEKARAPLRQVLKAARGEK